MHIQPNRSRWTRKRTEMWRRRWSNRKGWRRCRLWVVGAEGKTFCPPTCSTSCSVPLLCIYGYTCACLSRTLCLPTEDLLCRTPPLHLLQHVCCCSRRITTPPHRSGIRHHRPRPRHGHGQVLVLVLAVPMMMAVGLGPAASAYWT